MKVATFKCNQQRKAAKSWRGDKAPGGCARPPGTAPRDGQKEPGRKSLNTKGCRKELERFRRHSHRLEGADGFPKRRQLFQKLEENSQKSEYSNMSQNKKEEGWFWQLAVYRI